MVKNIEFFIYKRYLKASDHGKSHATRKFLSTEPLDSYENKVTLVAKVIETFSCLIQKSHISNSLI